MKILNTYLIMNALNIQSVLYETEFDWYLKHGNMELKKVSDNDAKKWIKKENLSETIIYE